jgi:serine/threonine protein kinase
MKQPSSFKTTFAQYKTVGIKGQGGSGVVYEALDDTGNKFAIKALDPVKASREKLKRFKNEFIFCSRNKHPNIITVLDHGLIDDVPFYVMPFYESSLRQLIGKIDPKKAMNVFFKIMDGIEAAHQLKVIHRDIKPENILVRNGGDDLVLADFGIAEFEEEDLFTAVDTRDGTRLANFQYAAPEQRLRGHQVDHRADIYSLGLILNELFTGTIPYGTNFKKIKDTSSDYPYLDGIVEKMLEQNPQSRFENIDNIKRELIARGEEFISLQKISKLENTVIPASDIDDPIVLNPMCIIKVDWDNDVLTIELNHPINPTWQWALLNMGNYSSLLGKGPERFQFRGTKATISARADQAQEIINYFKDWLPSANRVYKNKLKQDIDAEKKRQMNEINREIQKEQERLNLLLNLKF